jgi:hypothetical protein
MSPKTFVSPAVELEAVLDLDHEASSPAYVPSFVLEECCACVASP